jgi:hypothetical protein
MEKSSPKICYTSEIKKKLPTVNSNPIGENSPNLVTLEPKYSQLHNIDPLETPQAHLFWHAATHAAWTLSSGGQKLTHSFSLPPGQ